MTDYVEVYFDSPWSHDAVVATLGHILGLQFAKVEVPYADYLAVSNEGTPNFVSYDFSLSHDEEDDLGIPFTRMPYVLTIRGARNDKERHKKIAEDVFSKLKENECGPVCVMYADSQLLDYWNPGHAESSS